MRGRTGAVGIVLALWIGVGLPDAGLRRAAGQVHTPDVVYVGTPYDVVSRMLRMARVTERDVIFDLGCGDGRVVALAAGKYGCRGRGFDIDPERVRAAQRNVLKNRVGHLVEIIEADLFTLDLSAADVLALYLLPDINRRLLPQLEKLRPGVRLIFHDYDLEGFEADQTIQITSNEDGAAHTVYGYTTPLKRVRAGAVPPDAQAFMR